MEAQHRPDSVAIREALRGVRHVLRRVKASLQEMPGPPLPALAKEIADKAVREVDTLTAGMDLAASNLARRLLGGERASSIRLPGNVGSADFATALYWALQSFLRRFGIQDQLVSELAAREAYTKSLEQLPPSDALMAAELTCRLFEVRVIRGATPAGATALAAQEVRPVAIFSAVLWLLSDSSDGEEEETLLAAQDVALALRADVLRACNEGNRDQLGKLYHDFASHI